jgi:predicted regulator of Ras-like GTPase activity (Roadblock/LC7/MglB family)
MALDPKIAVQEVHDSLATLKDVAGIAGSFIFTRAGRLVARELPPMFDDTALTEAAGRLARLQETFAAAGDQLEIAVIRYRDHKLYVRMLPAGALCILSEGVVNMPALRMASNLVGRRVASALESLAALPLTVPFVPEVPAPAPSPPRSATLAPPGMRRFRGRSLE